MQSDYPDVWHENEPVNRAGYPLDERMMSWLTGAGLPGGPAKGVGVPTGSVGQMTGNDDRSIALEESLDSGRAVVAWWCWIAGLLDC
jgi:hypothetical protein